jgi:flagellar biosynthetic protein FliP
MIPRKFAELLCCTMIAVATAGSGDHAAAQSEPWNKIHAQQAQLPPVESAHFTALGQMDRSASGNSPDVAAANSQPNSPNPGSLEDRVRGGAGAWLGPDRLHTTLQFVLATTVLSLAPAILLMTTSFVRIAVVLGLLRQALGTQQLPSNQIVTAIALFMTLLIMTPVWTEVYESAIQPYSDPQVGMSAADAWAAGIRPVRRFMSRQIEIAGNHDDVWLFYQYLPAGTPPPGTYDDVPLQVLLPAFMLSELKTAFLIGFQIYLPFLILDLVVSSVTISMGMMMLPPTMVSLPFKLLLFVLVDGWNLVIGMLMQSFAPFG